MRGISVLIPPYTLLRSTFVNAIEYEAETRLYATSTRYYDPEIGRFINADGYVSTGQGVLGYSMFIYCGNNPVCRYDENGDRWITALCDDAREWLKTNKVKAEAKDGKTKTQGINISGAIGLAVAGSAGITTDNKGNIGIIATLCGGGGMPSFGAAGFQTETNAPDIYIQGGLGSQTGGSLSVSGISVGGEYNMLVNMEEDETYHGYTVLAGVGAAVIPAELHGEIGYSWVWGINLYDIALDVINWISPEEE